MAFVGGVRLCLRSLRFGHPLLPFIAVPGRGTIVFQLRDNQVVLRLLQHWDAQFELVLGPPL